MKFYDIFLAPFYLLVCGLGFCFLGYLDICKGVAKFLSGLFYLSQCRFMLILDRLDFFMETKKVHKKGDDGSN